MWNAPRRTCVPRRRAVAVVVVDPMAVGHPAVPAIGDDVLAAEELVIVGLWPPLPFSPSGRLLTAEVQRRAGISGMAATRFRDALHDRGVDDRVTVTRAYSVAYRPGVRPRPQRIAAALVRAARRADAATVILPAQTAGQIDWWARCVLTVWAPAGLRIRCNDRDVVVSSTATTVPRRPA